jgi:hypothetical protein
MHHIALCIPIASNYNQPLLIASKSLEFYFITSIGTTGNSLHRIASHRIHHIASHRIASHRASHCIHRIASHRHHIASHHIASHRIASPN